MKRSFPSRFYRERRDISTLSVLRKSASSCMIGRGMRDGERMDSERTGVETSSHPWGILFGGWSQWYKRKRR
jgi:hypothetical protein